MNRCCSGWHVRRTVMLTGLLAVIAVAGAWLLFGWRAGSRIDHDHGGNLVHEHTHTHDGQLNHDHWHWGISRVTHSHPHEHGHEHDSAIEVPSDGSLVQVGHVHGRSTKIYWVEIRRIDAALELNFLVEINGQCLANPLFGFQFNCGSISSIHEYVSGGSHLSRIHVSELKGYDNEVVEAYGINSVPRNFLVDPNGVIVARDLHGDELEKTFAEVLTGIN